MNFMEWHWYYIFGIVWVVVNVWAIVADRGPVNPKIEKLWQDNF
jgi:hypothetical protein